ncbi:hypothetical protein COCOBI_12-3460 [Coccomyxa sp. Obi]|nr:hypothetical protein COCOBI_12-3460 [Coccomyxa sp. Obi]
MRSFFSKLGGNAPKTAEGPRSAESDLPALLAKAADLLKQLRSATQEDFPLLNEATRQVQLLEGNIASLPDGDSKTIWRTQVAELQNELKSSTERMLSSNKPKAAEDSGASLFEGMNLAADAFNSAEQKSSRHRDTPQTPVGESDVLFTGLNLGPTPDTAKGTDIPVAEADTGAPMSVSAPIQGVSSGPLPEDLFSGLESLSVGVSNFEPTSSPAAVMPDISSPLQASHASQQPVPPALPRQASNMSSSSSTVSSLPPAASPSPGGVRRKRITRRVGYAREAADEDDDVAPPRSSHAPTGRERAAGSSPMAAAELGQFTGGVPGPSSEPISGTLDLLDTLAVPSMDSSSQVALEQPSGCGLDILMPESISTLQPGSPETPAASSMPQMDYQQEASQVSEGPVLLDSKLVATGRGAEQKDVLEERVREAAAACSAAKQRRRSLFAQVAASTKELEETTNAEAAAVEAEDFERAASLSAKADAAKARLADLDQALRAADAACTQAAVRRASHQDLFEAVSRRFEPWSGMPAKVAARLELAAQQAKQHSESAAALRRRQEELEQKAAQEATKMAQAQAAADEAATSSAEHLQELQARMEARQRWLEGEEAALAAKVAEATAPATTHLDQLLSAATVLRQEVEALRAQLAQKEAELAGMEAECAAGEVQVRTLSAKYDRAQALLQRDREALAAQQTELEDARAAAAAEAAAAAAATAEAERRHEDLRAQAESARMAAEEMQRAAEATSHQVEAEQRILQLHASLSAAEESAGAALLAVEADAERARVAARALAGQRAGFLAEARAAEEAALAARQRIPELEAEKRAAAAARDFKEAARLSAESKAQSTEAEAASAKAKGLRSRAAGLEADEAALSKDVTRLQGEVEAGKRILALAKWRRLKAVELDTKLQTDAAVSAEKFEEAGTLQAEHDAAAADANALASAHGFTDADLGDALLSLSAAPALSSTGLAIGAAPEHGGECCQGDGSQQSGGNLTEGRNAIAVQTPSSNGGETGAAEGIGEHHQGGDQQAAPAPPARMHATSTRRADAGARSASHVATEGSDSGYSVSLEASDGNLSSDADGHAPLAGAWTPPGQAAAGSDDPAAARQLPHAHVQAAMQSVASREALLREANLDRQVSDPDSASGYLADSDSVKERLAPHGSYSSIDSIITGAASLVRHPSGKLPAGNALPRAGRAAEPSVHTLEEAGSETEASSGHPVPALDLEQICEGKETGSTSSAGGDFDTTHSGRDMEQAFEPGMFGGLSMAEAAHMHHIDNAGSTAGTMGGDSTQWGGSDAGAGDFLGSARSGGVHADAAASDADESQDVVSMHGAHSGRDTGEVHQNGAHEEAGMLGVKGGDELGHAHSSSSVPSASIVSSPPAIKPVELPGGEHLLPLENRGGDAGAPEPAGF